MLFKLSNLNSNLALILGYLNPALNNSALEYRGGGGKTAREPRFSRRRQSVPVDLLTG